MSVVERETSETRIRLEITRGDGLATVSTTDVFAVARTAGWSSHWLELQGESHGIDRPRQIYVGQTLRNYPGKK